MHRGTAGTSLGSRSRINPESIPNQSRINPESIHQKLQFFIGDFDDVAALQDACFLADRLAIDTRVAAAFDMGDEISMWTPGEDRQPIAASAKRGDHTIQLDDSSRALAGEYLDPGLRKADPPRARRWHARLGRRVTGAVAGIAVGTVEPVDKHRALEIDGPRHPRIQIA